MNLEVFNLDEEKLLKDADVPDGLILKDINPCYTSSDAHTPLSPMRMTQTNIGVQLVKESAGDERYGVSKEQYGGVGPKYIKDPRYLNTPRTMWHARTGVHEEIPPPVSPQNRNLIVWSNKSLFASPLNEVGEDMFDLWYNSYVDTQFKPVERSLFPRSIVYELEYIKNENRKVMLAALEKERQAFEEKKMKKRNQAHQNKIDEDAKRIGQKREVDACETEPPFWWSDPSGRPIQPAPDPQTGDSLYTTNPVGATIERPDVVQEMQLNDTRKYMPGEIHKGAKIPVQLKREGKDDCQIADWTPRGADFHKKYDPEQVPATTHLQDNLASQNSGGKMVEKSGTPKIQSKTLEDTIHSAPGQPLGCQCHNHLVHRHLGHVATCTPLQPVIPSMKEEAAEVTAGGCMSISSICGCESFKQGQRTKVDRPKIMEWDFPGSEIRYSPYTEEERQREMFEVGIPFRTQAAKWMSMNCDPQPLRQPAKPPSPWRE